MKLTKKIPLLIGLAVLITAASITFTVDTIISKRMEESAFRELSSEAKVNADLIKTRLDADLSQLWEIANRARTRSMNWEGVVRANLMPDVSRIGALELGVIYPDYTARYVTDDSSANVAGYDFFIQAFAGKNTVSDVVISPVIKAPVVMLSVPILQNDLPNASVLGVLTARKEARKAMSYMVNQIKPNRPTGYAFMINKEGTVIAHPDESLVDSQFNPIKDAENDPSMRSLAEMFRYALNEQSGLATYTYKGETRICSFSEITGHNSWKLFVAIESRDFRNEVIQTRILILTIGIICLVAGIIIAIFMGRSIAKPVVLVSETLKDIAQGEGDLTHVVKIHSRDEIGDLAHYFNLTLGNIGNLVRTIKYKINALTNTSFELSSNMAKTSEAVKNITGSFEEMKQKEERAEQADKKASVALDNITAGIESLGRIVDEQSDRINTSSSAIEEMIANIQSVVRTLVENTKNVESLTEASVNGISGLQTVAGKIQEIARDSEGLLEINSVMENIASQTNLLSMNAAIEAAHAGESGKGFAVVAAEIRKLAESSGRQSQTTATMLKKIKASIDSITKLSGEVLNRFEAIDRGVKTVSEHEQNIRYAMEEQSAGGKQILDSVSRLRDISISVKNQTEELNVSGNELLVNAEEYMGIARLVIGGMNEIVSGAMREITHAVDNVDEMSTENNKNFTDLKRETDKFKVSTGGEKKKILVIDDDEMHLTVTRTTLEKEYEVKTVKSGHDALALLFRGYDPGLILLDIIMPDMDGWDTYERIKAISNLHSVPTAFFTSSDDEEDRVRAKKMGAADFIKKPIKQSELIGRVGKLVK